MMPDTTATDYENSSKLSSGAASDIQPLMLQTDCCHGVAVRHSSAASFPFLANKSRPKFSDNYEASNSVRYQSTVSCNHHNHNHNQSRNRSHSRCHNSQNLDLHHNRKYKSSFSLSSSSRVFSKRILRLSSALLSLLVAFLCLAAAVLCGMHGQWISDHSSNCDPHMFFEHTNVELAEKAALSRHEYSASTVADESNTMNGDASLSSSSKPTKQWPRSRNSLNSRNSQSFYKANTELMPNSLLLPNKCCVAVQLMITQSSSASSPWSPSSSSSVASVSPELAAAQNLRGGTVAREVIISHNFPFEVVAGTVGHHAPSLSRPSHKQENSSSKSSTSLKHDKASSSNSFSHSAAQGLSRSPSPPPPHSVPFEHSPDHSSVACVCKERKLLVSKYRRDTLNASNLNLQESSRLVEVTRYSNLTCRYVISALKDYLILQCSLMAVAFGVSLWLFCLHTRRIRPFCTTATCRRTL